MREIKITNMSAVIWCKSKFNQSYNSINIDTLILKDGVNILTGEIDSGGWGVSYMLSMADYDKKMLPGCPNDEMKIFIDGEWVRLSEVCKNACYMDRCYPLFSSKRKVSSMVANALKKSGVPYTVEEVRQLFNISDFRFERPLSGVGNEIFRCMAAIGTAAGKGMFCFPWMSALHLGYYQRQLFDPIETLAKIGKTIILPRTAGEAERVNVVTRSENNWTL